MGLIGAALPISRGSLPGTSRGLLPLETKQIGKDPTPAHSVISPARKRCLTAVKASSADSEFGAGGPSIVDANMTVLRKRMRELKMQERNGHAPEEWMEWEKKLYPTYHWKICQTVGSLQNYLQNTRPGAAIATLTLMSLGIAASVSIVFVYLAELTSNWQFGQ